MMRENNSDCGIFAIAYAQCLLELDYPAEYHFIHPRKHLTNYLPTGTLPKCLKVLAEHSFIVLYKAIHSIETSREETL